MDINEASYARGKSEALRDHKFSTNMLTTMIGIHTRIMREHGTPGNVVGDTQRAFLLGYVETWGKLDLGDIEHVTRTQPAEPAPMFTTVAEGIYDPQNDAFNVTKVYDDESNLADDGEDG